MRTSKILLSVIVLFSSVAFNSARAGASTDVCNYEVDSTSVRVDWTAFKTSQKVGVSGNFAEVVLAGELSNRDISKLFEDLEAEISLAPASIKTGNPARDQTLFDHFFKLFAHSKVEDAIHGQIKKMKFNKDRSGGTFDLKVTMNNKTKLVPFKFDLVKGDFTATGSIDVLDFGLSKALADLHKACEALHTGADGVSKTWPNVDLKLVAKIKSNCAQ